MKSHRPCWGHTAPSGCFSNVSWCQVAVFPQLSCDKNMEFGSPGLCKSTLCLSNPSSCLHSSHFITTSNQKSSHAIFQSRTTTWSRALSDFLYGWKVGLQWFFTGEIQGWIVFFQDFSMGFLDQLKNHQSLGRKPGMSLSRVESQQCAPMWSKLLEPVQVLRDG